MPNDEARIGAEPPKFDLEERTGKLKHWLRMIVSAHPELRDDAAKLWIEAKELNLIFAAIFRRKRSDN
jgi:hypothetical protein